jgi:hypothetical protein
MERERQHPLLGKMKYRNYFYPEGEEATPLFGLGPEETLKLINRMLYSPRVNWSRVRDLPLGRLRDLELVLASSSPSISKRGTTCIRIRKGCPHKLGYIVDHGDRASR